MVSLGEEAGHETPRINLEIFKTFESKGPVLSGQDEEKGTLK